MGIRDRFNEFRSAMVGRYGSDWKENLTLDEYAEGYMALAEVHTSIND